MDSSVDLYWLPLGAGGWFVRFNGRVYERIVSRRDGRKPLDLYHTALEITLPEGRYVIENSWPIPRGDRTARGVVVEGSVGSRLLGRLRVFRYEIRRWLGGSIPDADEAVRTDRLTEDEACARRILELAPEVPAHVWGRDVLGLGDMWNSNSVIAWLLQGAGFRAGDVCPPENGRAPGWRAGIAAAVRTAADRPPVAGSIGPTEVVPEEVRSS